MPTALIMHLNFDAVALIRKSLHNTALTALFSTFRPRHLHRKTAPSISMPCNFHILQSSSPKVKRKKLPQNLVLRQPLLILVLKNLTD